MNIADSDATTIDRTSKQPLYMQIQGYILDLIRTEQLKPGESVLSEHELAVQTGVSRLTVRKAYSELAKRGVLQTVQGKGTFIAESLTLAQIGLSRSIQETPNRTLGILFPEITEYFGRILREIERCASESGYAINVMFNDGIDKERHGIEQMLSQNLAGIILTPYRRRDHHATIDTYERLSSSGLPFVMIGKPPFHVNCDAIYVDDAVGVYDACQALVDRGHKEFVFLYNRTTSDPQGLIERTEGFMLAHRALQSGAEMRLIDTANDHWQNNLKELLLSDNPVTAILADGDRTAASTYQVIQECGKKIPGDVSVVGYDNSSICESLQVKLSSVAPHRAMLGRYAYELLLRQINRDNNWSNETLRHHIVVKPYLVIRDSIASRK